MLLSSDPKLAEEFRKRLESDAEFAKSAFARLDFFARRHSTWDKRYNLYPVLRANVIP